MEGRVLAALLAQPLALLVDLAPLGTTEDAQQLIDRFLLADAARRELSREDCLRLLKEIVHLRHQFPQVREVVLKLCIMLCHLESTTASGHGFQRLARDQFAELGTMPLPSPIKRAPDLPALEECRCPSFTLPALLLSD